VTIGAETQITDLEVNDHACLTFGETEELFDITAAYVRDGLTGGLRVVWLSGAGPEQAVSELGRRGVAAETAVAAGQMWAVSWEGRLLRGQTFKADEAMRWLATEMAACRDDGVRGLRIAVDMSWALGPVTGVEELPEFEERVAAALRDTTVSVLCQYDRERFDPVTLASVAAFHTRSVAAATYYADAMARICRQYAPPGIRLAGEVDFSAAEPLALALAEAIRLEGDVTVNMTELTFIDAACLRMIANAGRALTPRRTAVLVCRPVIGRLFTLAGLADVPGVRLVTADDR
jgi:anti-anti-sigma factor